MKNKALISFVGVFFGIILLAGSCSAGFIAGWTMSPKQAAGIQLPQDVKSTSSTSTSTDELFIPFWETWQILHDYYVDQPVDDVKLMQGAIRGMIESLGDLHSSYMDPFEYQDATASLSGEYEGIGAWVNTEGQYLTISEPMPGSPAEKAGLLPGDEIIAIDGEDMTGILPELARQRVLGPANSEVVLTIRREGQDAPFDVTVTRAAITVASVEGKMLEGQIAYVKVRNFGEKTPDELHEILKDLISQKPVGLILDLRNNPGGSLPTAIKLASEFLKDGVVLYEEYGDGTRDTHNVIPGGLATDVPMVVLVNELSASASEVVGGALQDANRATLVGTTTYGKGTVQQWIPLSNNQGAVRVTIARWLTPNGRLIHEVGLTPDVVVELSEEDMQANLDPQLDKAVEILTK
jgi:carboxyl-terminal processing protease